MTAPAPAPTPDPEGLAPSEPTPGAPATAPTEPARSRRPGTRSVFLALCGLLLRTQVTRTRLVSLGSLSALALLVGWALGASRARSHLNAGADFVNLYGLSLLVPVAVLVFASSMFGDLTDDGTLVYLWLRPISRVKLVAAAACTSFVVTWPLVVPPLVAAAALTRGGTDLVLGTLVSATVMVAAYVGVFLALGVRVRRPLVWGLLYIFIWEGFVARGSANAAKAAVRAYGTSILHHETGTTLVLGDIALGWAVSVPLVLGLLGLGYAVWRLHRQDVA